MKDQKSLFLGTTLAVSASIVCAILYRRSIRKQKNFLRLTSPQTLFDISRPRQQPTGKQVRTILVTGGNGFLGKYIVKMLLEFENINVVVFDLSIPQTEMRHPDVTYIQGNILNMNHLESMLSLVKVDSVIHTASLIPNIEVPDEAIYEVNITGVKNLLNCCQSSGVSFFVYTSSATVVLTRDCVVDLNIREDDPIRVDSGIDMYTKSKAIAEKLVLAVDQNKMATCSLRPPNIFGVGDRNLSDMCRTGQTTAILGNGLHLMDWTPVECVAHAHILAERALSNADSKDRVAGNAYFVGSNEVHTYGWFMGTGSPAESLSHWNHPRPTPLPVWLAFTLAYVNETVYSLFGVILLSAGFSPSLIQYTQRSYTFCSDKARRDFGYVPIISVVDAIKRIVQST